jgi:ElaB/YqjD/DUF883 family membrane-anchored ribosome-binding protein
MDSEPAAPDVIEKEMEQTRASLTDKVAALETTVVGTLQNATETVNTTVNTVQSTVESVKSAVEDTMSSVKESVTDSVSAVKEQVASTFDFSSHVRERPWAMIGGAAFAGFLVGMALPAARRSVFGAEPLGFQPTPGTPTPPSPSYAAEPPASAPVRAETPREPSWIDGLLAMAGTEFRRLGEEAVTMAVSTLRQSLQEQVPHLVETGVASATQAVASHLPGGAGDRFGVPAPQRANGPKL